MQLDLLYEFSSIGGGGINHRQMMPPETEAYQPRRGPKIEKCYYVSTQTLHTCMHIHVCCVFPQNH